MVNTPDSGGDAHDSRIDDSRGQFLQWPGYGLFRVVLPPKPFIRVDLDYDLRGNEARGEVFDKVLSPLPSTSGRVVPSDDAGGLPFILQQRHMHIPGAGSQHGIVHDLLAQGLLAQDVFIAAVCRKNVDGHILK